MFGISRTMSSLRSFAQRYSAPDSSAVRTVVKENDPAPRCAPSTTGDQKLAQKGCRAGGSERPNPTEAERRECDHYRDHHGEPDQAEQ